MTFICVCVCVCVCVYYCNAVPTRLFILSMYVIVYRFRPVTRREPHRRSDVVIFPRLTGKGWTEGAVLTFLHLHQGLFLHPVMA